MDPLLINIPSELFAPAESSHFEGEISVGRLSVGPDTYYFDAPLPWQVDITNTGDAFLVTGSVIGESRTSCARCLEEFPLTLHGEIEGYYLEDATKDAPEDMDDDEFEVLPESHDIDLAPLIQAALCVEVPLIPLCKETCKGLCPTCGANLNDGPCGCEPVSDDDDFTPPNPFAALKDYKFDN